MFAIHQRIRVLVLTAYMKKSKNNNEQITTNVVLHVLRVVNEFTLQRLQILYHT